MDDTDKLTGKKLENAKELLRNSKNFIIGHRPTKGFFC